MKKNAKKLLSLLLVLVMLLSLSVTALAKTSSEAIAPPSGSTDVFFVKIGAQTIHYAWSDISGSGKFDAKTDSYAAKVNNEQTTQEWTGVMLTDILSDLEAQTGIPLQDDYKVVATSADNYPTAFLIGDVKDAANRYMVAGDPVKNFDGDAAYDNSYVRIVRGDLETLSNQANLRCLLGIEIFNAAGDPIDKPDSSGDSFSDLQGYDWAAAAINYLDANGISNGTGGTNFSPAVNITRGDFMLMLYRAYDLTAETDGNFADVAVGAYCYDAVAVCKTLGIAKGDGENFNPNAGISRQDAMTFIFRTLLVKGLALPNSGDLSVFPDSGTIDSYALEAVTALVGAGVINGINGSINPDGNMTRAQMASALYKALTNI